MTAAAFFVRWWLLWLSMLGRYKWLIVGILGRSLPSEALAAKSARSLRWYFAVRHVTVGLSKHLRGRIDGGIGRTTE